MPISATHAIVAVSSIDDDLGERLALTLASVPRQVAGGAMMPGGQRFVAEFLNPTDEDRQTFVKGASVTIAVALAK